MEFDKNLFHTDRSALARYLSTLNSYMYSVPIRYGLSETDADDIVQEARINAMQYFTKFRGETNAEFQVWIWRIVKNKCEDFQRRNRRMKPGHPVDESLIDANMPTASRVIRKEQEEKELARLLSELDPVQADVLERYYFDQQKPAEIAEALQLKLDHVYKLIQRGVEKLGAKTSVSKFSRTLDK